MGLMDAVMDNGDAGVADGPGPKANEAALRMLETRRSVGNMFLAAPGPNAEELQRLLTITSRVPDHGRLEPWRFVLFSGEAREAVGRKLAAVYREEHGFMEPEKLEKFAGAVGRTFGYAPLVVLVVSRPQLTTKVPVREQQASAAAVCMNLLNAAHASGFGATWLTGWAADSQGAGRVYGLEDGERVIGIVHIGTPTEAPVERARPDLSRIVTEWTA
jgi:nitroreductase